MRRSFALKSRARPPSGMPLSCLAWEGPPALLVFLQAKGIGPELWAAVAGAAVAGTDPALQATEPDSVRGSIRNLAEKFIIPINSFGAT